MIFDWREYLELAKMIKDLSSQAFSKEASQRSAVSRAYYSAYGFATRYAESLGYKREKHSEDHKRLREFFKKEKELFSVYEDLRKLRNYRNLCDYEDTVENIDEIVEHSIKLAEKIIQTLS